MGYLIHLHRVHAHLLNLRPSRIYLCWYVIVYDASVICTANDRAGANLVKRPGVSPQGRGSRISLKTKQKQKKISKPHILSNRIQKNNHVRVLTKMIVYLDGESSVRIKDGEIA